jgi:phosphoribosylformylglycinamidine synthase
MGAPLQEMQREFSSSEYAKRIHGITAGAPPAMDLAAEKRLIDALVELAADGVLHSTHDVSDGGLAVALAECCFASSELLGGDFDLQTPSSEPLEYALFGERGARAVVSCAPESLARVQAIAGQYAVAASSIGRATRGDFRIQVSGKTILEADTTSLYDTWANALERALQG